MGAARNVKMLERLHLLHERNAIDRLGGEGAVAVPKYADSGMFRCPMPTSLRSKLDALAHSFADGVLAAIRTASLEDLLAESRGGLRAPGGDGKAQADPQRKRGRLPRRSQEEIEATLAKVIAAVRATRGKGLRAEEIRKALSLDVREVPRVLKEGLRRRKLKAKGQRRATVYRTA